jgi:hypothetical protein
MVFAMSCSESQKLGTGLVIPARARCDHPAQLLEEAEHLWAAERNSEELGKISASWGRVCLLHELTETPPAEILEAWSRRLQAPGESYRPVPNATEEEHLLDSGSGLARFEWPLDDETGEKLVDFDFLLMTATEPTLDNGRYPTPVQIAYAWRADKKGHVSYFHNNRLHGITTFQDEDILQVLQGEAPRPTPPPTLGT